MTGEVGQGTCLKDSSAFPDGQSPIRDPDLPGIALKPSRPWLVNAP